MATRAPLQQLAISLILGAAGFLGNRYHLHLFLNVDFLFGSFFVMLAIARLGPAGGLVAALLAGSWTLLQWQYPFGMIVFAGEALFVAFGSRRAPGNLVTLDTVYWLALGMPQVWLYHHLGLGTGYREALLFALQQSVNGIFNALLATILVYSIRLSRFGSAERRRQVSFRQLIFIGMVSVSLIPAFVYLVADVRRTMAAEEEQTRRSVLHLAEQAHDLLNAWVAGNQQTVVALARSVGDPATTPAARMQEKVELLRAANPCLKRMGVLNGRGLTVAHSPVVDAEGRSTLGVDFSDTPYLPALRLARKPLVGDVIAAKIPPHAPVLPLLAPILVEGGFRGYCTGIIDFDRLADQLRMLAKNRSAEITIIDRRRRVIVSSAPALRPMQPFPRPAGGEVRPLAGGVYRWLPGGGDGTGGERWSGSLIVKETRWSEDTPWTIVVEGSPAPYLELLTARSIQGFLLLWGLVVLTVTLSHLLSNRFVRSLQRIADISTDLPRIVADRSEPSWPDTRIGELASLVGNFRLLSATLSDYLKRLGELNEQLEKRVDERTEELRLSEERYSRLVNTANEGVWVLDERQRTSYVNQRLADLMGYTAKEMTGRPMDDFLAKGELPEAQRLERRRLGHCEQYETRMTRKDGSVIWLAISAAPLFDEENRFYGSSAMCADVTERKRVEEALRAAHEELERANRSLEVLAREDAMTGLANRRHFNETLEKELHRACRGGDFLSLILCDVDLFKRYNDRYGHIAGDGCLESIGRVMRRTFQRTSDLPARYGGEEFAIILPDTPPADAALMAEQLRREIVREALPHEASEVAECVTISLGVAGGRIDSLKSAQWLTNEADKALYRSKADGRNRVTTTAF